MYFDHTAFPSLLNLMGNVVPTCWVVSWPHSAQIRELGVKEEYLPLPDGKAGRDISERSEL